MQCLLLVGGSAVLGAVVGYVTNVVAIWLLFHPVRPRCLLGRRVCFQGLLPRHRSSFVRRVSAVASPRLEEILRGEYYRSAIRSALREHLRGEASRLLHGPLSLVPGLLRHVEAVIESVADKAADTVVELFSRAVSMVDLEEVIAKELSKLDEVELEKLFWSLAGRELRLIEILGAVIGAVIGLVQGLMLALLAGCH